VPESETSHREARGVERGRDLARILAFTDGVFAIAITLLVLQIDVPAGLTGNGDLLDALNRMIPDFLAFVISFAVIGIYWINHHRLMRMVGEYDRRLMQVTILFLFWLVLLPFSSQLIGEYGDEIPLAAVFYILNLALMTVVQAWMVQVIITHRLGEPGRSADLDLTFRSSCYVAGVFLASAPLGALLGAWTPLLWVPLMALDPFQRRRDRLAAGDD